MIRTYEYTDFDEVVEMYQDLIKTCYPSHKSGTVSHFKRVVLSWLDNGYDIFIAEEKGIIKGFSVSFVEPKSVIEAYYRVSLIYVKKKFRMTKISYLLYANVLNISMLLELKLHCNVYLGNSSAKIVSKYALPCFVEYIGGL